MPLKIELKPKERVILGDCVVTNGDRRARLVIDGSSFTPPNDRGTTGSFTSDWRVNS